MQNRRPTNNTVELRLDGWERFERAVDAALKSPLPRRKVADRVGAGHAHGDKAKEGDDHDALASRGMSDRR